MSLLTAIAERKSTRHQDAVHRYAAILEKGEESDSEELLELMESLGKSSSDVAADLQLLRSWDDSAARYETRHAIAEEGSLAKGALEERLAELEAAKRHGEFDSELDRRQIRFNQAESGYRVALNALDYLRALKNKHPDLFINRRLPA